VEKGEQKEFYSLLTFAGGSLSLEETLSVGKYQEQQLNEVEAKLEGRVLRWQEHRTELGLPPYCRNTELDLHYVGSLQTLGSVVDREFHTLSFIQRLKASFLNCSVMDKHIPATGGSLDKPKSLGIVEPFYGSLFSHAFFLC
jgi:hypothetical protein